MNVRKLQLELMRAILRSSSLEYDDVHPFVASLTPQVASVVLRMEQAKAEEQRKMEEQRKSLTGESKYTLSK